VALSWVVPAAKAIYDHREDILTGWDFVKRWLGSGKHLVFTGMPGSGKTVLLDYLSGAAFAPEYVLPDTSHSMERKKVARSRRRMNISVVPGQESAPRLEALEQLFLGKKPVDGIIHLVPNGFAEIRGAASASVLIEQTALDTIAKFRERQRALELDDFAATCQVIRRSLQKHRRPVWMLIAVSKADLYPHELLTAQAYYSHEGESPFSKCLQKLQAQVGSDNCRLDVLPVCACLKDFDWNNQTQKSELDEQQRNHLLCTFVKKLENFCGK